MHEKSGIGARLRACREGLKLTQAQLAEIGGVKRNTQSLYESDEYAPDARYLARIAEQGANVAWIVTGDGEPCRAPVSAEARASLGRLRATAEPAVSFDEQPSGSAGRLSNIETDLVQTYRALPEPDRAVLERVAAGLAAAQA